MEHNQNRDNGKEKENNTESNAKEGTAFDDLKGPVTKRPSQESSEEKSDSLEHETLSLEEGQILELVNVRFPGNARSFPFIYGKKRFIYGERVVAMSDRGMAVGYISSFPYSKQYEKQMGTLCTIVKSATESDLKREREHLEKERQSKELCVQIIKELALDMELTHVEYTQFGKKAVFYFTAPGRIDFRELVKRLVTSLRMRIELRQINIRDRTACIGGIGPCGRELCCSSFLKKYGAVNIKMAKNQQLTLSPNKLNGLCGQAKCCIQYEDDVYTEKRRILPSVGEFLSTANGDFGRVEKIHVLAEQFELITDQGIRKRYMAKMAIKASHKSVDAKLKANFLKNIDHVVDETTILIVPSVQEQVPPLHSRPTLASPPPPPPPQSDQSQKSNDSKGPKQHSQKNDMRRGSRKHRSRQHSLSRRDDRNRRRSRLHKKES